MRAPLSSPRQCAPPSGSLPVSPRVRRTQASRSQAAFANPLNPASIADGLLAYVGDLTFPVIQRDVEGIATVTDTEILAAVRRLFEVMKIAVEPSGAVGYAAIAGGKLAVREKRIGVILSGGNLDLERVLG